MIIKVNAKLSKLKRTLKIWKRLFGTLPINKMDEPITILHIYALQQFVVHPTAN